MLVDVADELLKQLEAEMAEIAAEELNPIEKLKRTVASADASLANLRAYVLAHPFGSDHQEIMFFKKIKPRFYCWKIYAFERYGVESWLPKTDEKSKRAFLMSELKTVERFFRLHDFHYQYYRLDASELDELLFLRSSNKSESILIPIVAEPDPEFATKADYLFAKFMALEELASWLQQQSLGLDGLQTANSVQIRTKKLKWTGESINLLELAYGIYYTSQVNDGKANIIDIVRELEEIFDVNLGRPYRRLAEIRQRKRLSRTKYIDEMATALNKKMDDENEFRPHY